MTRIINGVASEFEFPMNTGVFVQNDLIKENQELKKQLEEINKMIEKCGLANIEQVMLNYCGLLVQQKEFIEYLEDEIENSTFLKSLLETILQKYKSIIGDDK